METEVKVQDTEKNHRKVSVAANSTWCDQFRNETKLHAASWYVTNADPEMLEIFTDVFSVPGITYRVQIKTPYGLLIRVQIKTPYGLLICDSSGTKMKSVTEAKSWFRYKMNNKIENNGVWLVDNKKLFYNWKHHGLYKHRFIERKIIDNYFSKNIEGSL
jgi:hypothetical protein